MHLCMKLGKFPHEFANCTVEEVAFLQAALVSIYGKEEEGK